MSSSIFETRLCEKNSSDPTDQFRYKGKVSIVIMEINGSGFTSQSFNSPSFYD